jgi:hypothetical protein
MLHAEAGDVGFTQGTGSLAKAIRYATTGPREQKTWANHTLLFTKPGIVVPTGSLVSPSWQAESIEALWKVERNPWWERHQGDHGSKIRVYRPDFLQAENKHGLIETALSHEGEKYGWWKLGTHLLDRWAFDDKKVVSNLLRVDDRPICSYLVGRSFEIAGYRYAFGDLEPRAQDPDEQMDYCQLSAEFNPDTMCTWTFVGEATIP